MSNLMSDLLLGTIDPVTSNSVCNAGSKLLKLVAMEHKFGAVGRKQAGMPLLT